MCQASHLKFNTCTHKLLHYTEYLYLMMICGTRAERVPSPRHWNTACLHPRSLNLPLHNHLLTISQKLCDLILLVKCFRKLSAYADPSPFTKHAVSIKEYELAAYRNSYICLSY